MFNIMDTIIILLLIMGAVVGFKEGIIKKAVSLVGIILCLLISYFLKDLVAAFLYTHLPFIKFGGALNGIKSLNIFLYQILAFIIVMGLSLTIYYILVRVGSILEKLVRATMILALPSRILGAILGFVEAYIIVFIMVFILTLPIFNFDFVKTSKLKKGILEKTPLISNITKKSIDVVSDINKELNKKGSKEKINKKVMKILLDNDIIKEENIKKIESKVY